MNRLHNIVGLFIGIFLIFASPISLYAQEIGTCDRPSAEAYLDANNVRARIVNGAGLFRNGNSGVYEIPKGTGVNSIFYGSMWFVGSVDGDIRKSAGAWSVQEMWPGPIDDEGNPPTDCDAYDRIYKLSIEDLDEYDLTGNASEELRQWPTGLGAPTVDSEGNPVSLMDQPLSSRASRLIDLSAGERPAMPGSQSIWWVMNDRGNEHRNSLPIGIEVHGNAYASAWPKTVVDNSTLYRFRIFNKNNVTIENAYVGILLDADLGNFDDDYIGSDSTLGMGFVYNADNNDDIDIGGYGVPPPALGIFFMEGPIAKLDSIDNDRNGLVDETGERLRTTTVGHFHGGAGVTEEPFTPEHFLTYMQGKWKDGQPYTIGGLGRNFSNIPTNYIYPGDPVTGAFWSERNTDGLGTSRELYDRRFFISSGPFDIAADEDQSFTLAIVWAQGTNHLDSITELREAARDLRLAYDAGAIASPRSIPENPIPGEPDPAASLSATYPNPFSEKTTITYRVSNVVHVRLTVSDALGRPIGTLVNEIQEAGEYAIPFDGRDHPSGIYFYQIQIGHASTTKSMVLIK